MLYSFYLSKFDVCDLSITIMRIENLKKQTFINKLLLLNNNILFVLKIMIIYFVLKIKIIGGVF